VEFFFVGFLGTRTHTHSYTHANVPRQRGKAKRVRACIGPAMTCVFSSELEPVHSCFCVSGLAACTRAGTVHTVSGLRNGPVGLSRLWGALQNKHSI